jgi:hypothetical protein
MQFVPASFVVSIKDMMYPVLACIIPDMESPGASFRARTAYVAIAARRRLIHSARADLHVSQRHPFV